MEKKTCQNCEKSIENLEESFLHNNHVVCKLCKDILQDESKVIGGVGSDLQCEVNMSHSSCGTQNFSSESSEQEVTARKYGGVTRSGYFLGLAGLGIINAKTNSAFEDNPGMASIGTLIIAVFAFVLVINRLHNIGRSGWLALLLLIPIVNLFVGVPCGFLPEGYADTKKLDRTGKILVGIIIGSFVFMMVCLAVSFISS